MKKSLCITVLLALALLAGCTIGPDFEKPVMETPASFRFAESSFDASLEWWELFNDPALNSLVTAALNDNKDVLIAASRIEEARASLGFTKADQYPRLDLEASAERGNLSGNRKFDSTEDNFFGAGVASWELDFWGKFRRATEAARAELMASEYSLRSVQISLIAEVVTSYFLLLDSYQRLEISKRTLTSRIESLDIIQQRFDKGIIPEIDLNQAQIQKETAAAAIPVYERFISQIENSLSILLGRMPGEIEKGRDLYAQTTPPEIPVGLPSSLLERRPDIAQAEYVLRAQNARIGVAEALRLPAISLTGILGGASDELSTLTSGGAAWSISANVLGPIFNFDQDKMRIEIEKARTKQALYAYERTVLTAFREVEDALKELPTYREQIAAVKRQLKAAENAAELSRMRYDKGVTSFLEVLDTERILFSVELEYSELNRQYLNSYVRLYKSLGGGWISQEQMQNAKAEGNWSGHFQPALHSQLYDEKAKAH
ncbi:MAG: efflux transporter outer membrane subunit [Planctomycetota bacterium]